MDFVRKLEIGVLLIERRDKEQGAILRAWMDRHVLPTFAGRILAIDTTVAQRCAPLPVPNSRSDRDALIAATALVHGLTVVTNVADFERMGVGVLNPWELSGIPYLVHLRNSEQYPHLFWEANSIDEHLSSLPG